MLPKLTFVLGGAASGKSQWAENLLLASGLDPVYLATSRVFDDETNQRVEIHKSRRNEAWITVEADLDLAPALLARGDGQVVLVDCATMWLSNQMLDDRSVPKAQFAFLAALEACACPAVVVSNEVGHGIVPDNELARAFREAQGRLNIALATQADLVVTVTAGLPHVLKGTLA
jgi:adenosylcobinamide kinase/adenosylcobinamide-phosphate guanylyltransferase